MRKISAWLFLSVVLLITGIVYKSSVSQDFVGFDLSAYNAVLYSNSFADTTWLLFTDMRGALVPGYYAPLGSVSLLFDKALIGSELPDGRVTAFVNLLFHCLNGILLFLLLSRLGFSVAAACMAASIFLLHPIQVNSIMWFAERKTVMAACFCFLSYLCYLRHLQEGEIRGHDYRSELDFSPPPLTLPSPTGGQGFTCSPVPVPPGERVSPPHPPYHWYGLALAAFAAALLSKPTAVVLPAIMVVGEWLGIHRGAQLAPVATGVPRIRSGAGTAGHGEPRSVGQRLDRAGLLRIGPFALLAALMCLITIRTEGAHVMDLPIVSRPFIASAAFWFYVCKILLPIDLLAVYPKWNVNPADYVWWIPVILSALAAWLFFKYRFRIRREFWWALAFFVIPLLPVVGLVKFGYFQFAYVGNHLAYLSMAGAAAGLALVLESLVAAIDARIGRMRASDLAHSTDQAEIPTNSLAEIPPNPPLVKGGRVDMLGNGAERDLLTKGTRGNPDAVGVLGIERKPLGRLAGKMFFAAVVSYLAVLCAISWGQAALWGDPVKLWTHNKERCDTCWDVRYALGVVFLSSGLREKAALEYEGIISREPSHANVLSDLAVLRLNQNRIEEAIDLLKRAIKHKPDYILAHTNLVSALARQGRFEEAEELLQQSIRRWPNHARPYMALGLLRMDKGRYAEAEVLLTKAIQLDPVLVTAYSTLADAALRQGAIEKAHEVALRAIRLKANDVATLNILGAIEGEQGRPEKALEWLRRATRHEPNSPEPHHNMGIALLDLGRFGEARKSFEDAIRLNPEFAEAHENLGLTLMQLKIPDEAIKHLEKAVALNPGLDRARDALEDVRKLPDKANRPEDKRTPR